MKVRFHLRFYQNIAQLEYITETMKIKEKICLLQCSCKQPSKREEGFRKTIIFLSFKIQGLYF